MNELMAKKYIHTLIALVLIMVVIALGAYTLLTLEQRDTADGSYPATISVNGKGEVMAIPDIGQFSFSVMAEGDTAAVAQEASATKINEILAFIREQGIEDKDIKTQNYNLYPRYDWVEQPCPFGMYCPGGESVQNGFEATQTVTVKIRETDKASTLIQGVGERGATDISGLTFTVDDIEAVRAEARAAAIADAKEQAEELAKNLGVKIERLVSFYENTPYMDPYYAREMNMGGEMAMDAMAPQLPMGEESTTIEVNVTYEIKSKHR